MTINDKQMVKEEVMKCDNASGGEIVMINTLKRTKKAQESEKDIYKVLDIVDIRRYIRRYPIVRKALMLLLPDIQDISDELSDFFNKKEKCENG